MCPPSVQCCFFCVGMVLSTVCVDPPPPWPDFQSCIVVRVLAENIVHPKRFRTYNTYVILYEKTRPSYATLFVKDATTLVDVLRLRYQAVENLPLRKVFYLLLVAVYASPLLCGGCTERRTDRAPCPYSNKRANIQCRATLFGWKRWISMRFRQIFPIPRPHPLHR